MSVPVQQTYLCAICGAAPLFPSPAIAGDVVCAACREVYEARVEAAKRRHADRERRARRAARGWSA